MMHIPALADIARDMHPIVVIQKSAQIGVTELFVNLALWGADTGYAGRGNSFILMPTADQMSDFAQARVDRAIQDSTYLRQRLQPEPPRRKGADSRRLKRIGPGALYMRGSESARQVASVDADIMLLDEFDQMADGILPLAQRRLASSQRGLLRVASTPRFPEAGINGLYRQSDQRHYLIPCLQCGREQALSWEANVDHERVAIVCRWCREPLDVLAPGRWEAQAPGNATIHGYHLSRLYSPWVDLRAMIEASESTTIHAIQQFQNSDLGETFSPAGGGLSLDDLDRARRDYRLNDYAGQPCVMGVDIGNRKHVVIRELPGGAVRGTIPPGTARRLWFAGEVRELTDLDSLWQRFNVLRGVADSRPEGHFVRDFANRHPGSVWLAQYDRQYGGHERERGHQGEPNRYHVDRVEALDDMFDKFRRGELELPMDARALGGRPRQGVSEYYRELLAQQRVLEQDTQSNWVARYIDGGRDDHYAHAEVYCMLAGIPDTPYAVARAWGAGSDRLVEESRVRNATASNPRANVVERRKSAIRRPG